MKGLLCQALMLRAAAVVRAELHHSALSLSWHGFVKAGQFQENYG